MGINAPINTGALDGSGRCLRRLLTDQCSVFRALTLFAVLLTFPRAAAAQCQYEVTLIHAPFCGGGWQPITSGLDMSETGIVIGRYEQCALSTRSEAFMWSQATGFVTLIRPAGFTSVQAEGISPDGRYIVGWGRNSIADEYWSVLWDNGTPTLIEPTGDSEGIFAFDVNDAGVIVGTMDDPGPETSDLVPFRIVSGQVEVLTTSHSHRGFVNAVNSNATGAGYSGIAGVDSIPVIWAKESYLILERLSFPCSAFGACTGCAFSAIDVTS